MEIQGYIPINSKILDQYAPNVKLYLNRLSIEGGETETKNTFNCAITLRCIVNSPVPKVDDDDSDINFDKFVSITRGIKITTNDNLDIITNDGFLVIAYDLNNGNEQQIQLPDNCLAGMTIINILDNMENIGDLKNIIDTALDELKNVNLPDLDWTNIFLRNQEPYANIYLNTDIFNITNGTITEETQTASTGLQTTKKVWSGTTPLDKLIYVIQSNLDIQKDNQTLKGDMLANAFITLLNQAIICATQLEQSRLQLYENASQFQITSMIKYYLEAIASKLSILNNLAQYELSTMDKALKKVQTKLYYMQTNGFKAYNTQKAFSAQLDGATTAFSAGMTDEAPSIFNNAELTSLYTQVTTDMQLY